MVKYNYFFKWIVILISRLLVLWKILIHRGHRKLWLLGWVIKHSISSNWLWLILHLRYVHILRILNRIIVKLIRNHLESGLELHLMDKLIILHVINLLISFHIKFIIF